MENHGMSTREPAATFDEHPDRYDALIDWPRRLDNETPFYRRLFDEIGARRVLDAACGTGRHAAMFHGWGLEVEGADLSAGMIRLCRERHGAPAGLRGVERSFTATVDRPGYFDVALCVGNSLALIEDSDRPADGLSLLTETAAALLAAVRPGGACVVQVLNLWRFAEGPTVWQKCVRTQVADSRRILLKSVHRTGSRAHIDFVDLRQDPSDPLPDHFDATTFRGIEAAELTAAFCDAGAEGIALLGNYQGKPYDAASSPDLILTCRRSPAETELTC